ncbi:MAG: filamentous hemagglutinin N-terminal domain-containing protein [Cyanobacteria bacterium P01_D01_bin.2]
MAITIGSAMPGLAQATLVAGDGTANTLVNGNNLATCSVSLCQVTGGTQVGNSLFHSFAKFSVQSGDEINFVSADVDTIFTRVTDAHSFIDGTIGTTGGSSDLFLLNSRGIVFGENATLDIGGSFIATTADQVIFNNGAFFSATDTRLSSGLLSISTPVGLQYGAGSGAIEVGGSGHQITAAPFTGAFDRTNRSPGLQINPGQTLALVGGPLLLKGGNLTANDGRIELGSVANNQAVTLQEKTPGEWILGYGNVTGADNIWLGAAASIDSSGPGGGAIQIYGQQLALTDGSVIIANTQGAGSGSGIDVRTESTIIQGAAGPIISGLYSDAELAATGQAGDITLQSQQLALIEEGKISSVTLGAGSAGNIRVETGQLDMDGASFIVSSALPFVPGNTGDVTVVSDQITLSGGAQIVTSNFGTGTTGIMDVKSGHIVLTGENSDASLRSGFQALGFLSPGGQLTVDADHIQVLAGAQIAADTFGPGAGGDITLTSRQLDINGSSVTDTPSRVSTSVLAGATGTGGDITLTVDQLRLTNGGQVGVSTFGDGDAGTLYLTADTVELMGVGLGGRSGLFVNAIGGSGDGGSIDLSANRVTIQDGATVSASNFQSLDLLPPGQGSPGNIRLVTDRLALINGGSITADTAMGDRGNLTLVADTLTLQEGSRVSTNALGSSTGGNITIDAIAIVAINNSDISANAQQGVGGRIMVNAKLILGTAYRPQLTPQSDITASSELGPTFSGTVELSTPDDDLSQGIALLPTTPVDNNQQVARRCAAVGNSLVISGRGGVAADPSEVLGSESLWIDLRPASEQSLNLDGRITEELNPLQVSPQPDALIEAQTVSIENGQVRLVANTPSPQVDTDHMTACLP